MRFLGGKEIKQEQNKEGLPTFFIVCGEMKNSIYHATDCLLQIKLTCHVSRGRCNIPIAMHVPSLQRCQLRNQASLGLHGGSEPRGRLLGHRQVGVKIGRETADNYSGGGGGAVKTK